MALAGAAADVVGGAVTAAVGETGVGPGVPGGGAEQAVSSARIASAARRGRHHRGKATLPSGKGIAAPATGCDRSRRRRFVTKMGASVAKPTKATLKFGISAAL
jgi:hypothetical protein